jgi:hypothetical protein
VGADASGKAIAAIFRRRFINWQIVLPHADLRLRRRGQVRKAGWQIQYMFGRDERGEYADVYSDHRMAGSDHFRIYESGEPIELPSLIQNYSFRPELPGDEERARAEFYEHNRRVAAQLADKGFKLGLDDFLRAND